MLNQIWETPREYIKSYYLFWEWAGQQTHVVTVVLPKDCDIVSVSNVGTWEKQVRNGRVAVIFKGAPAPEGSFSWLLQFIRRARALVVPRAVLISKIDGKYTLVRGLEVTKSTTDSVWSSQVKNEWDDAIETKYEIDPPQKPGTKPEWYFRAKIDDRYLYMLIEGLSDNAIGRMEGYKDGRQRVSFWLVTDNSPTNIISKNVYYLDVYFVSPERLESGWKYQMGGITPTALPRDSYFYSWSISESPRSPDPHLVIEVAFNLTLLRKYYSVFYYSSWLSDSSINSLSHRTYINIIGMNVLPELRNRAKQAIDDASMQVASLRGLAQVVDKAKALLMNAQTAFDNGEYEYAIDFAGSVKTAIDVGSNLSSLENLKARLSNPSTPKAVNLTREALGEYYLAQMAFSENQFQTVTIHAGNAKALFEEAVSIEQAEAQRQQITNYATVGCGLASVAVILVMLLRRRRGLGRGTRFGVAKQEVESTRIPNRRFRKLCVCR